MKSIIATVLILGLHSAALAQSPAPTGNGTFSGSYGNPTWGQTGVTSWGTYSGGVGQNGWNFNSQLKPNEPVGSVLADPNALNSSFGNPRTGATLFKPQDTRLKGRDRP